MGDAASRGEPEEVGAVKARPCSVLDCTPGEVGHSREERFVIALGYPDGAVDYVAINSREGRQLVERLAFFLSRDGFRGVKYGTRSWYVRHSVLRAEAAVERDLEGAVERAKRQINDVWSFVEEELEVLKKLLSRKGRTAAKPETIRSRVRRSMITVIEAMRVDT